MELSPTMIVYLTMLGIVGVPLLLSSALVVVRVLFGTLVD
jgi:hypothetical protein